MRSEKNKFYGKNFQEAESWTIPSFHLGLGVVQVLTNQSGEILFEYMGIQ